MAAETGLNRTEAGTDAAEEGLPPDPKAFLPEDYETQAEQARLALPKIVVEKEYCTHAKGSDCRRCTACCPFGAIELAENGAPRVDDDLCTGCGICLGICDAFESTSLSLREVHKRMARIAVSGRRVWLTCSRFVKPKDDPDDCVVVLPCLSMVPPALMTQVLAEGIKISLICDLARCEHCKTAAPLGGRLYPRTVEIAQERTGEEVLAGRKVPQRKEEKKIEERLDEEDPLARRQAFEDLAGDVMDVLSGRRSIRQSTSLQDYLIRKSRRETAERIRLPEHDMFDTLGLGGRPRQLLFPQQRMLLETILIKPETAERIPVALSETDPELCCQAHDCAYSCPTGARRVRKQTGELAFEPMLCIGCGICVDVCRQGACSVDEADASRILASIAPEKLRELEERARSRQRRQPAEKQDG